MKKPPKAYAKETQRIIDLINDKLFKRALVASIEASQLLVPRFIEDCSNKI